MTVTPAFRRVLARARALPVRLSARALPLGLLALLGAAPARAERIDVHYAVTLIGLPIGTATLAGTVEPQRYRLEANARLSGLASLLSSSRGAATATGALSEGRPRPATFAVTSSSATMTRTIRIAMDAGTVTGLDIAPPFDPSVPRVPITEADKHAILDPLSAFVMSVPPGEPPAGPAACNRTLPIFDGGVRIDIALSFVGTRHVKAKGFEGDVAVCSVRYTPISGQKVDSKAARFMADNRDLDVWLAPIEGTHLVMPYRISVRTQVGTTVIEADAFTVDATHAAIQ